MHDKARNGVAAPAGTLGPTVHVQLETLRVATGERPGDGPGVVGASPVAGRGNAAKAVRTYLLVEVVHTKPISDLADVVAGRVWTLDGVQSSTATLVSQNAGWAALQHDRGLK